MSPDSSIAEAGKQISGALYTTDSVPAHQRQTYWREALSQTFAAVDIAVSDEVCSGTIRTSRLGHLRVAAVEGEPLRVRRTPRLIARGEDEYLVVKLLVKGVAVVEQDAREVRLHPGEIAFCDLTRPMRVEFPHPFQTKSLVLPRRLLDLGEPDLQRFAATPIRTDTALGSLLSPFLTQVVDTAETYSSATGEVLARHIVDLLAVLAGERIHQEAGDTPSAARVLLPRIQVFIDRHLADPDVTPEAIARAHQISVRYLHRLFETEGVTVSRWIQRRRLQECRRDLGRREAAGRTIAAVARQWGFTSAAHFSRVFRAAYGMSPAEWRDSAVRAPRTPPSPSGVSRVSEAATALRPRRSHLPPARSDVHLTGQAAETAA
ncbi:helix-turn-helix domain-containing protein [Streptomyces sp. NBC_01340]|uniref:AraC-like ligand-binding domain-containing protein n=1 Tax=unclassified Streptomyces TaxID=2593676 RepID=UPI00225ABA4B|nr:MULTISPECIES: helix-turn-helix domain-containing protein [unclassified Streptomyces]MCX4459435.1 helix-turn-helix domain-containing protein [Streptomyces sp. NBC_01719]MCX4498793.1 helix-turn-helix domain-containing protein [Streptomyces sp. NBC_01728]WSI43257.1 helix-turn-helix domain-containing protein [Streptomyces sp. NBC_01340]